MTGVACAAAVLKAEQQQSKVLARYARQSKAEYARRCQQEQSVKEALQQELASLKAGAGQAAATAAMPNNASARASSATTAKQLDSPKLTTSATATTLAVITKRKPEGNAGSSIDSPRIAAVMSSAPASHGAAPVEEPMVDKSANAAASTTEAAGAAASSIEIAGAAAGQPSETGSLQQAPFHVSAHHKTHSQQVKSTGAMVASLPGDASTEDLVQDTAVEVSEIEGARVLVTSQSSAASPAESGEKMDQEAVPVQHEGNCAEKVMLHGGHAGQQEAAPTTTSVEQHQVGCLLSS